jgi:hypothetical protein
VLFAGLQLGLAVIVDRWRPMWSDPEYGYRLKRLRALLAAEPARPLLLVLGSSRVGNGFKADDLPPPGQSGPAAPLVFNMSQSGGTSVSELLTLHRMLALGIRPKYLLIEVLAPALKLDENLLEPGRYLPERLRWSDLDVLRRHAAAGGAWKNYLAWLQWNAVPWYSDRYWLLGRYRPGWLQPGDRTSILVSFWRAALSPCGWLPFGYVTVTPEQYRTFSANVLAGYAPLYRELEVSKRVDLLFREMLEVCRREKITVLGLLLMPESSELRAVCPPEKRALIHSYLTRLCAEYGTAFIDATSWMSNDAFADGQHLLRGGASAFTARLWREALQPRLQAGSR